MVIKPLLRGDLEQLHCWNLPGVLAPGAESGTKGPQGMEEPPWNCLMLEYFAPKANFFWHHCISNQYMYEVSWSYIVKTVLCAVKTLRTLLNLNSFCPSLGSAKGPTNAEAVAPPKDKESAHSRRWPWMGEAPNPTWSTSVRWTPFFCMNVQQMGIPWSKSIERFNWNLYLWDLVEKLPTCQVSQGTCQQCCDGPRFAGHTHAKCLKTMKRR